MKNAGRYYRTLFFASVILLQFSASDGNYTSTVTSAIPRTSTTLRPEVVPSPESSMNSGLRVLYSMTSRFLDVVQPYGKDLFYELQLESGLKNNSEDPIGAIKMSFSSKAQSPKFFLNYFVGFVVCLAFGVVFIIVMPLVGLFLCLCRCCCHTCGHEEPGTVEKSRDKPKRIYLGSALFVFTVIILAGAICAFMSNELVRWRTSSSSDDVQSGSGRESSLITTILNNAGTIDAFKQRTVKEMKDLLGRTNGSLYAAIGKIYQFPEMATRRVKETMGGTELRDDISKLNSTLTEVVAALKAVDGDSSQLRSLVLTLNESLTELQDNLTTVCTGNTSTATPLCTPPSLTFTWDLSQVPNVSHLLTSLEAFASRGLNVSVFDERDISRRILKEMQPVFDAVSRADISGVISKVSTDVDSTANSLPSVKTLISEALGNQTAYYVEKYGNYRFNVCVAICSFLLLIVLLNSLALCIGACAKVPSDTHDNSGVTRWTAGHCLLASVALMFLFCLFLMIIVAVLFVTGGVVYTEGCRGFDSRQNTTLVKIADAMLKTKLGNVTFYEALRRCEANAGIIKAFNLNEAFNISGRFNLQALEDINVDEKFNISSIDLSQLNLTRPKSELGKLINSTLETNYINASNEMQNTTLELTKLHNAITTFDQAVENTTNPELKQRLNESAVKLHVLSDTFGANITATATHLRKSLKRLNESMYVSNSSKNLSEFLMDLLKLVDKTEIRIKNETPIVLLQLERNVSSEIKADVKNTVREAKTEMVTSVGRCRSISDAVEGSIFAVCHSTLDPYNAFWFSYGWCVFFFIPTIAVAVALATLYFRSDSDTNLFDTAYEAYKSSEYLRLQNFAAPEQDLPQRQPNDVNVSKAHNPNPSHYATNPGYVDDGDNSLPRRLGDNSSGLNFYEGVGHPGHGDYGHGPLGSNDEQRLYHIPRPTAEQSEGLNHRF